MRSARWLRNKAIFTALALVVLVVATGGSTLSADAAAKTASSVGKSIATASCEQAPAQSVKDRATYTPAELARYGLPPRTAAEPFEKWAQVVRAARTRNCSPIATNLQRTDVKHATWSGYAADQSQGNHNYTEIDVDYYVPCVNTPYSTLQDKSEWIGLGGARPTPTATYSGTPLVQTGTDVQDLYISNQGWVRTYWAWTENTLATAADDPIYGSNEKRLFAINCGDHMYAKVYSGACTKTNSQPGNICGCTYIQRLNDGSNGGTQCYGPPPSPQSAETIVERSPAAASLADFGTMTFHGVGITDTGTTWPGYRRMDELPNQRITMYGCKSFVEVDCAVDHNFNQVVNGHVLAWPTNITNDPGDVPYDQLSVVYNNLAQNGGFNTGNFNYWQLWPNTNWAVYHAGQVGNTPYEGAYFAATNSWQSGGSIYQDISVAISTGESFCVDAHVATQGTTGGAGGLLAIFLLNNNQEVGTQSFSNLPAGSNWTAIQACVSASRPHTNIRVQFYPNVNDPKTLVIDAVNVHYDTN